MDYIRVDDGNWGKGLRSQWQKPIGTDVLLGNVAMSGRIKMLTSQSVKRSEDMVVAQIPQNNYTLLSELRTDFPDYIQLFWMDAASLTGVHSPKVVTPIVCKQQTRPRETIPASEGLFATLIYCRLSLTLGKFCLYRMTSGSD